MHARIRRISLDLKWTNATFILSRSIYVIDDIMLTSYYDRYVISEVDKLGSLNLCNFKNIVIIQNFVLSVSGFLAVQFFTITIDYVTKFSKTCEISIQII